ncbi:MAG: hypothetical protein LBV42_01920 [Methanobrevibacter sp.]|jgi:hypothetical protein|nr:hypothetical protein [Methanobrevibacter sp.]
MFKKYVGLLIVYFIISLTFVPAFNAADPNINSTISGDKTKDNNPLSNNSTVNISTEHLL